MEKPRPYSGPVTFLDVTAAWVATWPGHVLLQVVRASPYLEENPTGVRPADWVELVAHVSAKKGTEPVATAERLALYVTTYREVHRKTLSPKAVEASQ
jgi:hypothetical protein